MDKAAHQFAEAASLRCDDSMKLPRAIRDKTSKTLRTREDALRYVLDKMQTRPGGESWKHAARLLIDKEASPESITRQIECALLLDGQLDVAFVEKQK
jgi:hypothetical protein